MDEKWIKADRGNLPNIQVLRGFAALNVVLLHAIATSVRYDRPAVNLSILGDWGANGVDIFFVISGFIMVWIQSRTPRAPIDFLRNRIRRVVPLYWILTTFLFLVLSAAPGVFRSLNSNFDLYVTSLLFATTFSSGERPLLYVGWTLEYELLFYLLFSFSILFGWSQIRPVLIGLVLALLVGLGWIDAIAFEFVFGMVCAALVLRFGTQYRLAFVATLIGSFGLLASIWLKPDLHRVFLYGVPAMFLVYGLAALGQCRTPALSYIGDASYSIYLVQVFSIPLFYKLSVYIFSGTPGDVAALFCVGFSALVGCLVYEVVEKPLAKGRRRGIRLNNDGTTTQNRR